MFTNDDLANIKLPPDIHATILTGHDTTRGNADLAYLVAWANRPYSRCPRCDEPVDQVVECPVNLDCGRPGGALQDNDLQHCCGEWLSVDWVESTPEDIATDAAVLTDRLAIKILAQRERIRNRLRNDLTEALRRLRAGESANEVTTGSQTQPGVYDEGDNVWVAWDFDPSETGETVTVYVSDLVPPDQREEV